MYLYKSIFVKNKIPRSTNNYFVLGYLILLMSMASCRDCDSCYSFFDPINGHTLATLDSLAIEQGYSSASNYIAVNSSFRDLGASLIIQVFTIILGVNIVAIIWRWLIILRSG